MKWYIILFNLLIIVVSNEVTDENVKNQPCLECETSRQTQNINSTRKLLRNNAETQSIHNYDKQTKSRRDIFNKENPFSTLRKQMNVKERKPELMADARVEPNYTLSNSKFPQYEYNADSGNYEQNYNKNNNKLRKLFKLHNPMKELGYVLMAGIECDFERDCTWTWATNVKNGFQVTSPVNYEKLDTGPMYDANNNTDGKFFNKLLHVNRY